MVTLKSLNLMEVEALKDRDMELICSKVTGIEELMLSGCIQVTDASLLSIGAHLSNLDVLELSGIPHITLTGVDCVAAKCRQLMTITLIETPGVDKEDPTALTAKFPEGCQIAITADDGHMHNHGQGNAWHGHGDDDDDDDDMDDEAIDSDMDEFIDDGSSDGIGDAGDSDIDLEYEDID
jgi:hypothetical protein